MLLTPLFVGALVEFLPKFSTSEVWQCLRDSSSNLEMKTQKPITVFSGVPTMYVRLLQGFNTMDTEAQKACSFAARNLRLMMCGSSALPQPVMEKWETVTGHCLLERYGMTEFGMAISNPLNGERRPGYVGKPFPGVEVRIAADETGVGELYVKSPGMFSEYWRQPEVTKNAFTEDGFFETGDTATMENDYIRILGRTLHD